MKARLIRRSRENPITTRNFLCAVYHEDCDRVEIENILVRTSKGYLARTLGGISLVAGSAAGVITGVLAYSQTNNFQFAANCGAAFAALFGALPLISVRPELKSLKDLAFQRMWDLRIKADENVRFEEPYSPN